MLVMLSFPSIRILCTASLRALLCVQPYHVHNSQTFQDPDHLRIS